MTELRDALSTARLYAIIDTMYAPEDRHEAIARAIIDGGVDIVQLRAKSLLPEHVLRPALRLAPLFRAANIPFIINDHPDVAAQSGATGVHVGQDDMPVSQARSIAGAAALVGKSTHSIDQATATLAERPDYIAFGPLYANQTKPTYLPVGLNDIAQVRALAEAAKTPLFCIGGIKEHNLHAVLAAGAPRVVIVSELLRALDIAAYCRRIREHLDSIA